MVFWCDKRKNLDNSIIQKRGINNELIFAFTCLIYFIFTVDKSQAKLNLKAIPEGFVMAECPAPFLKDPEAKAGTNDSVNPTYCQFGCCIPCPAQDLVSTQLYLYIQIKKS